MEPVRETSAGRVSQHIARLTAWLFQNSRPQFHYALVVLYHAGIQLAALWVVLWLFSILGMLGQIDFSAVGYLVGPLALGGLAAGHVKALAQMPERVARWVVPGIYGGVAGLAYWVIVRLKWYSVEWVSCFYAFCAGAVIFNVLAWLMRQDQKGKQSAA